MSNVRVIQTAYIGTPDGEMRVNAGEEFPSDHPLVKAYPKLFTRPLAAPPAAPRRRRNA